MLSPILFNLYTNDLPETVSRKFIYADDICCALQKKSFEELEKGLNLDLEALAGYCHQWRLIPSTAKTVSSIFHLHNQNANRQLNIMLEGRRIEHDAKPVYLGVTLDRTLSYKEHLSKTSAKIKTKII